MNAATAKKFLFKNNLPADFELWKKLAIGLVECSKELQVDGQYLERFEKFKEDLKYIKTKFNDGLNIAPELDITPDMYAETVAALDADIDRMINLPGAPDNVKELLKRYEASIKNYRPSEIIDGLRSQLEWIKGSLSQTEDLINDAQNDLDGAQDDIDEVEEKLDKLAELYNECFDNEEDEK